MSVCLFEVIAIVRDKESLLRPRITLTCFCMGPSIQVFLINSVTSFVVDVGSDMLGDRRCVNC